MEPQKTPNSQTHPVGRWGEARGITLPHFKLHYKPTMINTALFWQKSRQTNGTRMQGPEINSHVYGQLVFNKGAKIIQC